MKIRTDEVVSRTTHDAWEFFYTGNDNPSLTPVYNEGDKLIALKLKDEPLGLHEGVPYGAM